MKIKLLTVSFLTLASVSSCKKNVSTPDSGANLLISQINHISGSASEITSFKYDSQNRLIEYSNNGSTPASEKYSYDANNHITDYYDSYTSAASQYNPVAIISLAHYSFSYNTTNTINTNITYTTNGTPAGSTQQTITLNDKGQTIKIDYGNNQYSLYTYDAIGNRLTQSDYFNLETKPRYVFTYTYDQKKGYFSNQKGNVYELVLPSWLNNPIMQTEVDSSVSPAAITTIASTFDYDGNGYPTKETRVKTSSRSTATTTDVYTYTYITI